MRYLFICFLLNLFTAFTNALLTWSFQPAIDLSCSPSTSASSALASSLLFGFPKYAELIVGGVSFGPLSVDQNRVSAPLLSQPFDNCFVGGNITGSSSNAPPSFSLTAGVAGSEGSIEWTFTLTLQFTNNSSNSSSVFHLQTTNAAVNFSPPRTQMRNVPGSFEQVTVMFDQPVQMKTSDAFQFPEGGSVSDFQRVSALVYVLKFDIPPASQSIPVILPPLDGPFGPPSLLGKTVVFNINQQPSTSSSSSSSPSSTSFNPPLLLSEDLGYFNQLQTTVLMIVSSTSDLGTLNASCFSATTQGSTVGTVQILDSPAPGSYRISVPVQGEGSFTLNVAAGCLTNAGVPSLPTNITLTRDVTPPTIKLSSSVPPNQTTRNTSFNLSLDSSEPVYLDQALDLRTITGGGTISRIRSESSALHSASVTDIAVDPDGVAILTVSLLIGSVADRAGNAGPAAKQQITVRVLGNATRTPAPVYSPPQASGGDSALEWVLIALAVLVAGLLLVYFVSKRRQKRVWAPADPEEEFENYGMRIFEQYAGAEQEYMTFDDIVRHSNSRGYPLAEAERGARVLIRAAGSGDRISRDEWMRWLRRKVTRGQTPTVNHLRELRTVFPLR